MFTRFRYERAQLHTPCTPLAPRSAPRTRLARCTRRFVSTQSRHHPSPRHLSQVITFSTCKHPVAFPSAARMLTCTSVPHTSPAPALAHASSCTTLGTSLHAHAYPRPPPPSRPLSAAFNCPAGCLRVRCVCTALSPPTLQPLAPFPLTPTRLRPRARPACRRRPPLLPCLGLAAHVHEVDALQARQSVHAVGVGGGVGACVWGQHGSEGRQSRDTLRSKGQACPGSPRSRLTAVGFSTVKVACLTQLYLPRAHAPACPALPRAAPSQPALACPEKAVTVPPCFCRSPLSSGRTTGSASNDSTTS